MKKLIVIFLLCILSVPVFATDAPKWTGKYVNDYAGVLNNKNELESALAHMEANKSVEFAIVTLNSLPPDETKETYSYKIFNTWGLGKKTENNGLLFLMIVNQTSGNRMRLEIGYGLEGYITDASAGRTLDKALSYYEAGDYSQASAVVVQDMAAKIINYQSGYKKENYSGIFPYAIFMFSLFFLIISIVIGLISVKPRCPVCGSYKLTEKGDFYVCDKGHKFRKKRVRSYYGAMVAGGGFRGGGFGRGGFGGGASGGGGAGR